MKPTKGFSLNTSIYDVPEGYVVMARNAINSYIEGCVIKERGFIPLDKLPYRHIGTIETPTKTFLFSTDNINSAISVFENDLLTTVIDDKYKLFKFKFNTSNPIKGVAIKNFKDEWIGTWLDGKNPIRLINFDNPTVQVETDLSLFPIYQVPTVTATVQDGGTVNKGTYIPFVRYIDTDYTYTDYIACGKPIYVDGKKLDISSKQIIVELTNLDIRYDYFELAFYHIQAGITNAVVLDKKPISEYVRVAISSTSQFNSTGVADLLVNSPFYTQAEAVTQNKSRLLFGGVEEPEELNLQRIANKIIIKAKSTLVGDLLKTSTNCSSTIAYPLLQNNYGDGNIKTFIHGETYAFYLVGVLSTGRRTRGFTIPGRVALPSDLAVSQFDACRKTYEVENTARVDNLSIGTFVMGYWENQDEQYPNKPEFEENINKRVRHHVMPSIAFCKDKLYKNNAEYGNKTLDVLGIIAENVIIPTELKDKLVGYEIYYAKRSFDNQRILGQSLSLLGTNKIGDLGKIRLEGEQSQSTGGNWSTRWSYRGSEIASFELQARLDVIRLHSFDLLNYKPSVENCSIQNQLSLTINSLGDSGTYLDLTNEEVNKVVDYTLNKTTIASVPTTDYYRTFNNHSYLPAQAYTDLYDNRTLESCFVGTLNKPLSLKLSTLSRLSNGPQPIAFEQAYLTNLLAIKLNVYQSFYNQELVYTGQMHTADKTVVMYCGDGFISDYSFVTYGLRESNDLNAVEGNKFIHRFICESNSNVALRYEEEGNIYSYFYPKANGTFLRDLSRDKDPNQWEYDNEWNKVYDVNGVTCYNAFDNPVVIHPNRIIVSAEESKEKGLRSWRNFLTLDYVEIKKEKGKIVALDSQDDRLLIKVEHTLLVSEGIRTLGAEGDVYLKSIDITDQQFQDVYDDTVGLLGGNQKFAFYKTPLGQVIVDQKQKNIYIYKNGLKKLNVSLNTFFKDNLLEQGTNPYLDKGYIVTYDTLYDRLLFTQKSDDKSFTFSYSLKDDNWVSMHDYIPDSYIRQEGATYNIRDNRIYKMNVGDYGKYYDNDVKPFYLDIPFTYRGESGKLKEFITDSISWLTEGKTEFKTLSHITVYTPHQCTGRIGLYSKNWYDFNYRKLEGEFSFNDIRDNLTTRDSLFFTSIMQFKQLLQTQGLFNGKVWYNKDVISDKVVVVRVEDDNFSNTDLVVQDISINITPSDR